MAAAEMLIVPSYFESLSMVTLEAWGLGRPVVANGRCDVLKGQCIRSNAGLCYESYPEFLATVRALEESRRFGMALGANGRTFFRENYEWSVIERKYLRMFDELQQAPAISRIEPLPGWLERRRRTLPPAQEVVAGLPRGAVIPAAAARDAARPPRWRGRRRETSPSGACHAGLRRCHRPRGTRHSAGPSLGRL